MSSYKITFSYSEDIGWGGTLEQLCETPFGWEWKDRGDIIVSEYPELLIQFNELGWLDKLKQK